MTRLFVFLIILISTSCSMKGPSREVKTFVQSMEDQYNPKDPRYLDVYQRYLASVEKIYVKNEKKTEFRSYLDSLNSNFQTMDDQREAMPELFKKQTGQKITESTQQPYLQFRKRQMNDLTDKLYSSRELKLKEEGGEKVFEELKVNYAKFMKLEQAEDYGFPL